MNILITGGASGLGEAITRLLAKNAVHKVFFTFAKSDKQANQITSEFKNTNSIHCDFNNLESVNNLSKQISEFDIDVLINNAYSDFLSNAHFHKIPENNFLYDYKCNIFPVIKITQAAILHFRKKKSGKIITILTSYLHNTPPIGLSCYVANKAYLGSLVKSWAAENTKFNITSNSVSPSFMLTNLNANVDERIIEQMISDHPLKKLLTPEEVATTVQQIINSNSQINGVDFAINTATNIK